MSLREFAEEVGVSASYYCKIEEGLRIPSYNFLVKLKTRYPQISIDQMFFDKIKRP